MLGILGDGGWRVARDKRVGGRGDQRSAQRGAGLPVVAGSPRAPTGVCGLGISIYVVLVVPLLLAYGPIDRLIVFCYN